MKTAKYIEQGLQRYFFLKKNADLPRYHREKRTLETKQKDILKGG